MTNDPFLLQRTQAAELFLIRHGDAIPEADEIAVNGMYSNLPLSRVGRKQALALAERLQSIHFDVIYSSPLRRCQETAAPLVEQLELTPTIIEDIREVGLGKVIALPAVDEKDGLEGRTRLFQALVKRQEEITRLAAGTGSWDAIEGSESSKAFRKRVVRAIDAIASRHIGERVLIFAHGGVINAYAAEVLGLEQDFFFPCANTSITMVRASAERRVLYIMNDIAHLKL
jgi:2,3-bisphosphoglycerate-dependent phosphoglycerate mutase